jgi:hypothetical protein
MATPAIACRRVDLPAGAVEFALSLIVILIIILIILLKVWLPPGSHKTIAAKYVQDNISVDR